MIKDYQFFQLYAGLPMSKRNDVIHVFYLGLMRWDNVYTELSKGTNKGKEMLEIINKHHLDKLLKKDSLTKNI